jgi:acyl carrier protein
LGRTGGCFRIRGTGVGFLSTDEVKQAFAAALDLPAGANVEDLEIGANPQWDSVGHMALVAELEDRFGINLDTDDIVDMSSYVKSLAILRRYGIAV